MLSLRSKTISCLALSIMLVLSFLALPASAENDTDAYTKYFYVRGTGFVSIHYDTDEFYISTYNDGKSSISCHIRQKALSAGTGCNTLLVALSPMASQPVLILNSGKSCRTVFLSDLLLKENCLCSDSSGRIYAVDERTPDTVKIFSSSGKERASVSSERDIISLLCSENGDVYALQSGGIMNISKKCFYVCETPDMITAQNGDYLSGTDGTLYKIGENGLELILSTGFDGICRTGSGRLFAYKDCTIFRLDDEGCPIRSMEIDCPPDYLIAGEKRAAYITNENIYYISESSMNTADQSDPRIIGDPTDNSRTNREDTSRVEKISEITIDKISSSKTGVTVPIDKHTAERFSSGVYNISNQYITGIEPGTSISKFKKDICCDGYEISFTDHHGRKASSGTIGTGWKVCIENDETKLSFSAVVTGDVTGEGNCNSRDTDRLCYYLLHELTLSDAEMLAADTDGNGTIDLCDLFLM